MIDYDRSVSTLAMPLPEDIEKRKWAGDLKGAMAAIDLRVRDDIPEELRLRLLCEKERLRRLPTQYPWNREQAIAQLQALVPDATAEEFDRLELEGRIDFLYLEGEKRYFVRFARSLAKTILLDRTGKSTGPAHPFLDPIVKKIEEEGGMRCRITLEARLDLVPERFTPGVYQAWLPFPARSAQQSAIRLEGEAPDFLTDEQAPARTAWWRRELKAWQPFRVRYSYESAIRYADPLHRPAPDAPLYPDALPVAPEDTQEDGTCILFTPYLRRLEKELAEGAKDDAERAWRYYRFVTEKVKYSFVRDYFQIDRLGEYCAVNLKGDCGLQALLFICLCRIGQIPARWQSGLSIGADGAGSHDWAQFYLPGWGWLFADCSFGGSAYRAGNLERQAFYFGNLDPMRMVANRVYMAPFVPPCRTYRHDPFDNQTGELILEGAALPFTGRDLDETVDVIGIETL